MGSADRVLNLAQESANPVVAALTLREARERLRDSLGHLPELARRLEEAAPQALVKATIGAEPRWVLALDHEEPSGFAIRHHLPFETGAEAITPRLAEFQAGIRATQPPISQLLGPLEPDPLTVADDETFLERLSHQRNVPDHVKAGLPALF